MKAPRQILALSLCAIAVILFLGGSGFLGHMAWARFRTAAQSPLPALDISFAVLMCMVALPMADKGLRLLWFLCSGRVAMAPPLWKKAMFCLIGVAFAAVLVSLVFAFLKLS